MPPQKRGQSKQDYATPSNFIKAVEARFGKLELDLAAHQDNHVTPRYYGPGGIYPDSLAVDWPTTGNLWLNPPFDNITPWVKKCYANTERSSSRAYIHLLVPASVGANWFADYVHEKAYVLALQGRLHFDRLHPKWGYPKDCILAVYGPGYRPAFTVWNWEKDL
jgi:phage N-6-adenine-methyltransferase